MSYHSQKKPCERGCYYQPTKPNTRTKDTDCDEVDKSPSFPFIMAAPGKNGTKGDTGSKGDTGANLNWYHN
jgi:hypothetical protein